MNNIDYIALQWIKQCTVTRML